MIPERYLADQSIEEWEALQGALFTAIERRDAAEAELAERDALAREAERVRTIRASLANATYAGDDPGFRGLSYVGDSFAPVAVYR